MPAVMEAIDNMSVVDRMKTLEYLWAAMTASGEPEPPAWHADVLSERRSRAASGRESFMTLEESRQRLREAVHAS